MRKFMFLIVIMVLALGLTLAGCVRDTTGTTNGAANGTANDANGTNGTNGTTNGATNGTTSQVAGTTAEQIYAYIREINEQARTITFDEVEMVSNSDTARRDQLGLVDNDFNNGYYRYNTTRGTRMLPLADNLAFDMDDLNAADLDFGSGIDYINGAISANNDNLYCLTIQDGQVVGVRNCENLSSYDLDNLNGLNGTNMDNLNDNINNINNINNNPTDINRNTGTTTAPNGIL